MYIALCMQCYIKSNIYFRELEFKIGAIVV